LHSIARRLGRIGLPLRIEVDIDYHEAKVFDNSKDPVAPTSRVLRPVVASPNAGYCMLGGARAQLPTPLVFSLIHHNALPRRAYHFLPLKNHRLMGLHPSDVHWTALMQLVCTL
jgi:hypothetical protein